MDFPKEVTEQVHPSLTPIRCLFMLNLLRFCRRELIIEFVMPGEFSKRLSLHVAELIVVNVVSSHGLANCKRNRFVP